MTLPKPTFRDFVWLAAVILLPLFGSAQALKNDTVKIKAIVSGWFIGSMGMTPNPKKPQDVVFTKGNTMTEGTALIVRGYAVYKVQWDMTDIDPGFSGRQQNKTYTLLNILSTNKKDTLKYVYDYKELDW